MNVNKIFDVLDDTSGRRKRNVAHSLSIQVVVDLGNYDFLADGTYNNDTGTYHCS